MSKKTTQRLAGATSVAAAALLVGTSAALGHGVGRAANRVTVAAAAANVYLEPIISKTLWVKTMDPAVVTDLTSANVMQKIYAGLLKQAYNDNTKRFDIVPDLAQSVPTPTNGGTVYTFKLRPNLKFSDGTPLTSADVVASIQRALDPKLASPVASYLYAIGNAAAYNGKKAGSLTGVKALDASTVQVTLAKPAAYFLYAFTYPTSYVLKKGTSLTADLTHKPKLVVGAGPFELKGGNWQYQRQITLVPNPNYYAAKSIKVSELDLPFVTTVGAAFTGYQAGQYPTAQIPSVQVPSYRGKPEFHNTPVLGTAYYCMNPKDKPFTSKHFRLAVAYAINRPAIINGVLKGTVLPLSGWYPQGILGYDAGIGKQVPYYDPTRAKSELALAKKELGGSISSISFEYPSDNEDTGRVSLQVQSDLKAIGISMTLKPVPGNTWLADGVAAKTPFIFSDWYDDYPDPQDFSDYLLRTGAGENFGAYSNPQVDALFNKGNVTLDTASRESYYKQAQVTALNDAGVVMLYQFASQAVISTKIHGMEINPSWGAFPQPLHNDWANVTIAG